MSLARRLFFWLRVSLLLAVFYFAYVLLDMSREADPRFYYFLDSPLGRKMADLFKWRGGQGEDVPENKPDAAWTAAELAARTALEDRARAELPTHRLLLVGGQQMVGRITAETPGSITFTEQYGDSGEMAMTLDRRRVRSFETLPVKPPAVTYRDVRFHLEFPDMNFYKRPPYSIVTDESYFQVESTVRVLRDLHREFMDVFGPLVDAGRRNESVQVLFFSREEPYRAYQRQYAGNLENAIGFYSVWLGRLVLFNQLSSRMYEEAQQQVQAEEEAHLRMAESAEHRAAIRNWRNDVDRQLTGLAAEQTRTTVRHEGAHQLFYDTGIHSSFRAENDWLVEGLAGYCETPRLGDRDPHRAALLHRQREANQLIPLEQLVNSRSTSGLMVFGQNEQVEAAYAQSWCLVHLLMQKEYRERFFSYLRFVRDPANLKEIVRVTGQDVLCRCLGVSPAVLQQAYLAHLDAL